MNQFLYFSPTEISIIIISNWKILLTKEMWLFLIVSMREAIYVFTIREVLENIWNIKINSTEMSKEKNDINRDLSSLFKIVRKRTMITKWVNIFLFSLFIFKLRFVIFWRRDSFKSWRNFLKLYLCYVQLSWCYRLCFFRMLISWQHASIWLILLWICTPTSTLCPSLCTCEKDHRGKHRTSCLKGGITQLPMKEVDTNVEILEIDAPTKNPNSLTISPIFQHLKHLEELIVRRSQLKQLGMHSFWGVPSIKVLDFTFNNITSVLDHNFRGLVNLVELNLDHNRISNMQSGAFKHLTELRILSLRFNLLVELVPRMFMKLGKLHVLRLSGNTFEELDPEAFKDIPVSRLWSSDLRNFI